MIEIQEFYDATLNELMTTKVSSNTGCAQIIKPQGKAIIKTTDEEVKREIERGKDV